MPRTTIALLVLLAACKRPEFRDAEDFANQLVDRERCAAIADEVQRVGKEALTTSDQARAQALLARSKQLVELLDAC